MKKVLLAILLMIITTTSLFALSSFYMAPYGATMINLDNPSWDYINDVENGRLGSNERIFPDARLVFVGGLEELKVFGILESEFNDYKIRLEFGDSASWDGQYFWFTKQNDPEFRRPFQIQIGYRVYKDGLLFDTNEYADLGYLGASDNEELEASPSWLAALLSIGDYNIVFEFGIILPGDIKNGILTLDDGTTTYPIASGTDYSAEINITATLVAQNDAEIPADVPETISFTLPISGYYDQRYPDGAGTENFDTSASLYVTPYARAANINIRDDQGTGQIPIAGVDFAIYDLSDTWTDGQYDDSAFIFLSASSNPFVQDTRGFRFVHESVGFGDAELPTNSIGYTITAVPDSAGGASVTFDGTDYMTVTELPENKITTVHNDMTLGSLFDDGTDDWTGRVHWHSWNGELMLTLDTNNRMMNEGLYRSTVYVHVVTNDSLDQGGTA